MARGKFIAFEGVDDAGKTTHVDKLWRYLEDTHTLDVVKTQEPCVGAGLVLAVTKMVKPIHPVAKLLAYCGDRVQRVHEVIEPALKNGEWVVCDRYELSTVAYRLAGAQVFGPDWQVKWRQFKELFPILEPDLTILLDGTWEHTQNGIEDPGEEIEDRRVFWQRVRDQYACEFMVNKQKIVQIRDPQSMSVAETHGIITHEIERRFFNG